MISGASSFNQPIGERHVAVLTNLNDMSCDASAFTQPTGEWDVTTFTNRSCASSQPSAFNLAIDEWNVAAVTTMMKSFTGASALTSPLVSGMLQQSRIGRGCISTTTSHYAPPATTSSIVQTFVLLIRIDRSELHDCFMKLPSSSPTCDDGGDSESCTLRPRVEGTAQAAPSAR